MLKDQDSYNNKPDWMVEKIMEDDGSDCLRKRVIVRHLAPRWVLEDVEDGDDENEIVEAFAAYYWNRNSLIAAEDFEEDYMSEVIEDYEYDGDDEDDEDEDKHYEDAEEEALDKSLDILIQDAHMRME